MKRSNSPVGALAMAMALGLTGCATTPAPSNSDLTATSISALAPARAAAIDEFFTELTSLAMFDGTVIVEQRGQIIFERSYGFANYETRTPFNDRTLFRIASLSKGMTDAALAAMIVNGQLRLEDRVSQYLPDFPRGNEITLQQLVDHTSGIAHPNDTDWGDGSQPLTLDEIIAHLAAMPLNFEPGAREQYSNGGFAVLTKAMEVASGETYPQLMQRLVFEPLGMHDVGIFGDSRAAIENMATGYEPGPAIGARRHSRVYYPESRPGGGSIYASAADVLRFARAAYRGEMWGAREYPGLFAGSEPTFGATGRAPGFNSILYYDRAEDLIVVVLSNSYSSPYRIASNTAAMALGRPALYAIPDVDLTRPADQRWVGDWQYAFGSQVHTVELSPGPAGELVWRFEDSAAVMIPLADGGYIDTSYQSLCQLQADNPDRIVCGRFMEGGFQMILERRAP